MDGKYYLLTSQTTGLVLHQGNIPIKFTNKEEAETYLAYLVSNIGGIVYEKWKYEVTEHEENIEVQQSEKHLQNAEQFLKSKGINLKSTTLISYIDGAMRQPNLCELMEEYALLKGEK